MAGYALRLILQKGELSHIIYEQPQQPCQHSVLSSLTNNKFSFKNLKLSFKSLKFSSQNLTFLFKIFNFNFLPQILLAGVAMTSSVGWSGPCNSLTFCPISPLSSGQQRDTPLFNCQNPSSKTRSHRQISIGFASSCQVNTGQMAFKRLHLQSRSEIQTRSVFGRSTLVPFPDVWSSKSVRNLNNLVQILDRKIGPKTKLKSWDKQLDHFRNNFF